jgi:hypothetical protein
VTTFVQLKDRKGADVYVNPDRVLFVESHANETQPYSFIHFEGHELAVKGDIATVVKALGSS